MDKYRTQGERLLVNMLSHVSEDMTIPRYIVKLKCGPWLDAAGLDKVLAELGLPVHRRPDRWKGQYYDATEVADRLFKLRQELDEIEKEAIEGKLAELRKAW